MTRPKHPYLRGGSRLSTGPLIHPRTGKVIQIDDAFVRTLQKNFDDKVCDIVQVPIADKTNAHTEDPLRNAGRVVGLEREGNKVYAVMDIADPAVADKLGKTLLGASAMLHLDYTDTRTGARVGPTLLHSLVTNRPYCLGLEDYQEVVAATAEAYDVLGDGSVLAPDVLMLAAPSEESLMLASPQDYENLERPGPQPDYRRHSMSMPDDEIQRLGMAAERLSRHNGGMAPVTSAGARVNRAYVNPPQGWRPSQDERHAAAHVAAEVPLTGPDIDLEACTDYALRLSGRLNGEASFGTLMDAARELARQKNAATANEPRAIGEALLELAAKFGDPADNVGTDMLELAADSEAERYDALYLAGSSRSVPGEDPQVREILERNPDILSAEPTSGPNRLPAALHTEEDELGTEHPIGKVTSKRRARSGQTSTSAEVDRLTREYKGSGMFGPEKPYGSVQETRPLSGAARQAAETRELAGGRPQRRIER